MVEHTLSIYLVGLVLLHFLTDNVSGHRVDLAFAKLPWVNKENDGFESWGSNVSG